MTKGSMKISRTWKIVIGAATAFVAVQPTVSLYFYLSWLLPILRSGASVLTDPAFFSKFFVLFPILMLAGLLQTGLTIFYVIHTFMSGSDPGIVRLVLGLSTCFLAFIAMPAYFVIYIWLEVTPDWDRRAKPITGVKP